MLRNSFSRHPRARRRGISMVLFTLSLPVIIGMTGLVVDMTNLYTRRAYAQRAADAAALAGALVSSPAVSDGSIIAESKEYARLNGYSAGQVDVNARVGGVAGKVQVTVSRTETVFFMPIMEFLLGNDPVKARTVAATGTAQKFGNIRLPMGGNYGTTTGPSNPSAFGPYAKHSYGDPYSVLYHDPVNGVLTPNTPENVSHNLGTGYDTKAHYQPDGFVYTMNVSSDFALNNPKLFVELYDPDGYDSKDKEELDEFHSDFLGEGRKIPQTTTRYIIEKLDSNKSYKPVAEAEYGNDSSVDAATLKAQGKNPWITPKGFDIDMTTFGPGEYRVRVKTIDGSSENGYNLRAGPKYTQPEEKVRTKQEWDALENDWNQQYGDKGGADPANIKVPILADDHLQMNFTRTGNVKVRLGFVPGSAAGQDLTVTKFDTDVGSTNIRYSFAPGDGSSPQYAEGQDFLDDDNDVWSQNQVKVPAGFGGGYLYAEYDAGKNDTSSWSMSVPGEGETVKLIK